MPAQRRKNLITFDAVQQFNETTTAKAEEENKKHYWKR